MGDSKILDQLDELEKLLELQNQNNQQHQRMINVSSMIVQGMYSNESFMQSKIMLYRDKDPSEMMDSISREAYRQAQSLLKLFYK